MGHLPSDVAPDLRSRSYAIDGSRYEIPRTDGAQGVLVAHGDATCGYSLFVRDGRLVHDLNIGGSHQLVGSSDCPMSRLARATELGFRMQPQTRRTAVPLPHGTGHTARRWCRSPPGR